MKGMRLITSAFTSLMRRKPTRSSQKKNLAYTQKAYPQTVAREFKGLAHAELVLMFPERFYAGATRFLRED